MPLHIDLRPTSFDEVIGNQANVESLKAQVAREDRSHCYLFIGPSGTGKTTLARILAKELGCLETDFYEYNTANTRGIDTIRDIQNKCKLLPHGKVKFYLLDECHQITGPAAEAMLKMLEDTPSYCYFVLATTNPEKLIPTVKTRATTFETKLLLNREMETLIKKILGVVLQNEADSFPNTVIQQIVKVSQGCPREAIKLLDQVIDMSDEQTALQVIKSFHSESPEVIDLCRAIFTPTGNTPFQKWQVTKDMLTKIFENKTDVETVRRAILGYMCSIFIKAKTEEGAKRMNDIMSDFERNMYDSGKAGLYSAVFISCYR